MNARAHSAVDRAIVKRDSHAQLMLEALEELRARSAPERIPQLVDGIGDACLQLQTVLSSPGFRARIGVNFPDLPQLGLAAATAAGSTGVLALGDCSVVAPSTSENNSDRDSEDDVTTRGQGTQLDRSSRRPLTEKRRSDHREPTQTPLRRERPRAHTAPTTWRSLCTPHLVLSPHDDEPRAIVACLAASACGPGWRQHDRRLLHVLDGKLLIFEKGSSTKVKSVVQVEEDIHECVWLPNKIVSIMLQRVPLNGKREDGVFDTKVYFFQFPTADISSLFRTEFERLRRSCE